MMLSTDQLDELRDRFTAMRSKRHLAILLTRAWDFAYPDEEPLDLDLRTLAYLAFQRKDRYRSFRIPKRSGGVRRIEAPIPALKRVQRALNISFQAVFEPHPRAFGFVPGRSIADNAREHVGRNFVYNVDIADFFPNTSFRRVKTMLELKPFRLSDDREPLAFLIANCCARQKGGEGYLPQGAPTSPTLTNVVCQRLDRRLHRLARRHGACYTRYADDITFSADYNPFEEGLGEEIAQVIEEEGYRINPKKVRLQSRHERQMVTGLVVNDKLNVPRSYIDDIRYHFHVWETYGYERAEVDYRDRNAARIAMEGAGKSLVRVLSGKIAFLQMVRGKEDAMVKRFWRTLRELPAGDAEALDGREPASLDLHRYREAIAA